MKKHKICIVGGGLTGLISALVLSEKGLDIDLIIENSKSKKKDLRVTAISENNLEFLKASLKNINLKLMQNFLQRDLGSSLLSIAVILGWIGLFIVFMRILTISIKRILEAVFKKS